MDQKKYPANWGNICEASSFLMLFPLASILIIIDFIKTKKTDPLLMAMVIFQLFIFVWLFFGFPSFLAQITLFKTSPSYRAFFILGFANVFSTILFLVHYKDSILKNNIVTKIGAFAAIFIIVYFINSSLNKQSVSFFSSQQVFTATLVFAGLNWLVIFFNRSKIHQYAFLIACFLVVLPNIKINPLSVGLSPYYENGVYKTVSAVEKQDPGQGWMVFGAFTYCNFIKAAGINCFDGNQCVPPLDKLHILDPEMKYDSIYNRYAHIDVGPYINEDSVKFTLQQNDLYSIRMDPCSPRLTQMGIKYILFTYKPQPIEVECMTPVKDTLGIYIFKRKEG